VFGASWMTVVLNENSSEFFAIIIITKFIFLFLSFKFNEKVFVFFHPLSKTAAIVKGRISLIFMHEILSDTITFLTDFGWVEFCIGVCFANFLFIRTLAIARVCPSFPVLSADLIQARIPLAVVL